VNAVQSLSPSQLSVFLLHVAVVRPVFIWGPPGIGKSALVARFADELGMPCVSLLGSQLAPEDLIGVPQIVDGVSRFFPPAMIARKDAYCLFLDELNACSHEVQKAFYSLIHERRIGEYVLPEGSVVIGAGNRAQDAAIVKPMSSALINRMLHVHLKVSPVDWLAWAADAGIHPRVIEYVTNRPDHLWSPPPKHEEPFSTPRGWHMLSDALHSFGDGITDDELAMIAYGALSPSHAGQFVAFSKQIRGRYQLDAILRGDVGWPSNASDRDVLYYLAQSFRARLIKELPSDKDRLSGSGQSLAHSGKRLLKDLSRVSMEIAQTVVQADSDAALPDWFMVEIMRDLPRLVETKKPA
jgi:hypothetical protein